MKRPAYSPPYLLPTAPLTIPHNATDTPFAGVSVANPITFTTLPPTTDTPDTCLEKVH